MVIAAVEGVRRVRVAGQLGDRAADGAHPVLVCQVAAGRCSRRGRPLDLHWPLSSSAIASSWETAPGLPAATHSRCAASGWPRSSFSRSADRGAARDRLEPSQLGQRDDRGCFAAEVDHLIGLVRDAGRLRGHAATYPDRRDTAMPPADATQACIPGGPARPSGSPCGRTMGSLPSSANGRHGRGGSRFEAAAALLKVSDTNEMGEPNGGPTPTGIRPRQATSSHGCGWQMPRRATYSHVQRRFVLALQARGRWFEPSCAHQPKLSL